MASFFTADTHFGDDGLIAKMGREWPGTREEHDSHLVDRINTKVGRKDTLYIVGDFAPTNPARYRNRLRCQCLFVRGNHDKYQASVLAFGSAPDRRIIKFGGTKAVLNHHPEIYWNGSHKGWYHLYGHCHANREATLDAAFPARRSIDVGVDNANLLLGDFEPFSEAEILGLLEDRPGHDPVAFYTGNRDPLAQDSVDNIEIAENGDG